MPTLERPTKAASSRSLCGRGRARVRVRVRRIRARVRVRVRMRVRVRARVTWADLRQRVHGDIGRYGEI